MAELKSANSARPGSLAKPVPGAGEQDEADAFLAGLEAPALAVDAAAPDEADQFLSGLEQESAPPSPEQFAAEPGFAQANMEQFNPQNFVTRLQAGLAANDTEKTAFLQKKYGKENVAMKDGKLYYRKDKSQKLRPLDPATFELISDIIPDFAREIVTEATMLPAEIAGGVLGTTITPGLGTAAGVVGARAASVPFANAQADAMAEAAGVPQDPSRNLRQENLIGMGTEVVAPLVVGKAAKMVAKQIPGTLAYKAAREAGEKEVVALSDQSREVAEAAFNLEQEGIKVPLTLQQVQPDSPKIKQLAKKVEGSGEFINKQMEFAEGYGNALKNNLREIALRSSKGDVPPEKLAQTITNAVEDLDKLEGAKIGAFRTKAMAKIKNEKSQLPQQLSQDATELMKTLGFQTKLRKVELIRRAGSLASAEQQGSFGAKKVINRYDWVPPKDLSGIVGRLGLDDSQARMVINTMNEYGKLMTRGNEARLTDVERMISRMGPINRRLQGTGLGAKWGQMTAALRQHRREIIGKGLDDGTDAGRMDVELFNKSMDDFGVIRNNLDQLSSALNGEVTARTLVKSFFKGKENLANVRALKKLTGNDSAQWGALKAEFVDQLIVDFGGKSTPTRFESEKFLNAIKTQYGEPFLREVLDDGKVGPNFDTIKNLLTVGRRIEAEQVGLKPDTAAESVKQGIFNTMAGLVANYGSRTLSGVSTILGVNSGQKKAVFEMLNRDGFEKYLAGYKGKDKAKVAAAIQKLTSQYNAARAGSKVLQTVEQAGRRGAKATLREEAMRND